jgi:multicomponent Na+:H+ antiporter subunit C
MQFALAIVIGLMFTGGTYLILRPNLIRIVMGFGLYSNAANLLMITCGGYTTAKAPPFVVEGLAPSAMMDPIPPDIILTAIVISFATGALFLTLSYRVYLDTGTDDPQKLPNQEPLSDEAGGAGIVEAKPDGEADELDQIEAQVRSVTAGVKDLDSQIQNQKHEPANATPRISA